MCTAPRLPGSLLPSFEELRRAVAATTGTAAQRLCSLLSCLLQLRLLQTLSEQLKLRSKMTSVTFCLAPQLLKDLETKP